MKELIQKHKRLAIAIGISLVLLLIILAFFVMLLIGGSSNKYGNRLDGIDEVKISDDALDTIAIEMKEKEGVKDSSVRIQGKIINVILTFNSDVDSKKSKEVAASTLESFSEEQLAFYNVQYFLTRESSGEEDTPYVITGNKHPSKEEIGWTNNGE